MNSLQRGSNQEINCLEFGLTLALLAKMYYPEIIAYPLAYTRPSQGERKTNSRHFMLWWVELDQEGQLGEPHVTRYSGQTAKDLSYQAVVRANSLSETTDTLDGLLRSIHVMTDWVQQRQAQHRR